MEFFRGISLLGQCISGGVRESAEDKGKNRSPAVVSLGGNWTIAVFDSAESRAGSANTQPEQFERGPGTFP
jgi:hypothetical protein